MILMQQVTELIGDEGLRLYVYDDATGQPIVSGYQVQGHPTIGYGRTLDLAGIANYEAAEFLKSDLENVQAELVASFSWFNGLDPVRRGVLINLCYNLGLSGLKTFRHMLAYLAKGDFAGASGELANSKWAQEVQAERSQRLIAQLRSGALSGESSVPSEVWYPGEAVQLSGTVTLNVALDPTTLNTILQTLQAGFTNIQQEIQTMSATLEQQVQQATAAIQQSAATLTSDMQTIQNAITQLQQSAQPGSTLTQADVDALNAAEQAVNSAMGSANTIASSVSNIQPTPSPNTTPPSSGPTPNPNAP